MGEPSEAYLELQCKIAKREKVLGFEDYIEDYI
jgi:hypothetical protein